MSDAGTFEIRELTGDKRTVRLSDRGLPYRPFSLEGKHKVSSTTAPGFASKSQQPLGAEENNCKINGRWCDMYLFSHEVALITSGAVVVDGMEAITVNDTDVSLASEVTEVMDDIRRKGQEIRVSWMHIARIGRLVTFGQKWFTGSDVEWEMEFDWIGFDETAGMPTPATPDVAEAAHQTATAYVSLQEAIGFDGVWDLDPSIADLIDARVGRIQQTILDVEDAVVARTEAITGTVAAAQRAIGLLAFAQDEAELLIAQLDGMVAPALVLVTDPTNLTPVAAGPAITAAIALRKAVRAARELAGRAGRQRVRMNRDAEANIIAVVMVRQEMDLRTLALDYYGTADDWQILRAFNGLAASALTVGTVVLIPTRGGGR